MITNLIPLNEFLIKNNLRASRLAQPHDELLAKVNSPAKLPTSVSLLNRCPEPYDQSVLGSCTGNALAMTIDILENSATNISTSASTTTTPSPTATSAFRPSRLFIYYNERAVEGDVADDSGADEMDGLNYTAQYGVCSETTWPYDVKQFAVKPPQQAYTEALKHKIVGVHNIPKNKDFLNSIKAALALGLPVTAGFVVYESFMSDQVAKTGIVPIPKKGEKCEGGHEICIIGYDDSKQELLIRNSWGSGWGQHGNFVVTYAFVNSYFDQATYATSFVNSQWQ